MVASSKREVLSATPTITFPAIDAQKPFFDSPQDLGSPFRTKAPTIPPLSALTSAACATYTTLVSVLSTRPICNDISAL